MKFTRYIAMAALLIVALLGISAFASGTPVKHDQSAAVASAKASGLQLHKQVVSSQQVNACQTTDSVLELNKANLQERVRAAAYNQTAAPVRVFRISTYDRMRFKPNIVNRHILKNGFAGLGFDHFARADV